jgi:acyl dehydratase
MAIDKNTILQAALDEMTVAYDETRVILYALGVGCGRDHSQPRALSFVDERSLQAIPTLACALGWRTDLAGKTGVDMQHVLHGEQRLTLTRPLMPSATVVISERVIDVFDKGPDKGAILLQEKLIRDAATYEVIARGVATVVARADGGFGGRRDGAPRPHPLPDRAPDVEVVSATRPEQAHLYALTGDRNPIHRNPDDARMAGFDRPILHGLCTYGIACHTVINAFCDGDAGTISAFDARFTAPVYPGDSLVTELWRDGLVVSFRTRVAERGVVALDNGRCLLGFTNNLQTITALEESPR